MQQFGGGSGESDLAAFEEIGPFGHGESHVDALLDEDHRDTIARHALHDREHLPNNHRCQTEREFVDEQHPGSHHEAHRQGEHLLLTARQVDGRFVEAGRQHREDLEHFGLGSFDSGGIAPIGPARQVEVLAHRERTEHAGATGHLHDAEMRDLVRRRVGDVAPVEDHCTAVGFHHATDGLEQCALTRTVGAEQRDDLPFFEVHVDAVQHWSSVVARPNTAQDEQLGSTLAAFVQHF